MENIELKENKDQLPKGLVIWSVILALVIVALAWGLPAAFGDSNNKWLFNNKVDFGLYLALKIFFVIYFIGWTIYWFFFAKRKPKVISGSMLGACFTAQGLPGLIRLGQFMPGFDPGWAILLFVVLILIYIGLIIYSLIYMLYGEDYEGKLKGDVTPGKKYKKYSPDYEERQEKEEAKKVKAKKIEIDK